jgi:DNA-binding SARP family transcriptional activator/Tfp pilus assembly protein PilF
MEFRVLGRLEVSVGAEQLDLGAPKQQIVLASLLLSGNKIVSGDQLTEAVWWQPPAAAAANLRVYLAGLRRVLRVAGEAPRVETLRGGYRLTVLPGELDLDRFEELTGQGEHAVRESRLSDAAGHFEQASRLWRDRALDDMAYGPGLQMRVAQLEERRLALIEQWAQVRLDLGDHSDVVTKLRGMVAEHPLRERLWAQLMLALSRSGRPTEALAAYAKARAVLVEELGADPGPELQRLHRQLLRGDDAPASSPAERGTATAAGTLIRRGPAATIIPRQLPAGPSAFCGRTAELAQLEQLLAGAQVRRGSVVVAVDGTAGVGKSALVLTAAHQYADRFPDGQLYINLQGATPGLEPLPPVEVLGRFLRTFGVSPNSVPADEAEAAALFRSQVADRRLLVVLDNAASIAQVRPLLPAGPGCVALVTGRDVLTGLAEANRLHLVLLSPGDAVDLLGQVAGPERVAADPDAVARLVALCGHLPLALRIAGARLAARPGWPVRALAGRLQAAQTRLDELSVPDAAVRASIELTYRGLAEQTRRAMRRLGLLRARDFTAWGLAALMDTPLANAERLLDDLIAVHLVEVSSSTGQGDSRYRFHDLVRLFAQERAAEEDPQQVRAAALRRLVGAAMALAERADLRLGADFLGVARHRLARWSLPREEVERITADPGDWFDSEHDFLIAAVDEGIDIGATDLAGGLAASLTTFFQVRNRFTDWRRVQSHALVAALQAGDNRTALKLHRGLGELDTIQDRYADAVVHFETALGLATARDSEYETALAAGLGYLNRLLGQYEKALRYFSQARVLAEKTGNVNGLVYAANGIGGIHLERGHLDEAASYFQECLRLSREASYLPGEAQALRSLGHVHRAGGDHDEAAELFLRAKEISETLGDRLGQAHAASWLAEMRIRQGRHAEARWLLARCLWGYREFGNAWGEAATLWAIAVAHLAVALPGKAQRRAEGAVAIWRRIESPHWLALGLETLADAHDGLGEQAEAERARAEALDLRRRLAQAGPDTAA